MKTDFSIDINRKVELQDEIIKNFEEEKIKLLNTIESLEFEKGFDKEMNHNAFDTAIGHVDDSLKNLQSKSIIVPSINSATK